MTVHGKHFDLRVSLLPSVHGQSAVMRILDRGIFKSTFEILVSVKRTNLKFQQIIKRPNGIFLVTGPTGSGKTTTLYAALNELNRPDRKIITAEDPVEYYLPASIRWKSSTASGWISPGSSVRCFGKPPTLSWSAKFATKRPRKSLCKLL